MGKTCLKDIIKVAKELKADYLKNIEKEENKELYISTDSREDFNNDKIFLAIKGEKFNGNDFALDCYNKGCRYFILSENIKMPEDAKVFYYDDTIIFFIKLAREYRRRFDIPIIAITGSCGKTTTKELTALFLSTKYKVLKTEGNLNNEIGVPKTIFNLDKTFQIAIIEAGMNHKNELLRISEAIESDLILINNIEEVHLSNLGSIKNIALAKSELFNNAKKNAIAIINKNSNQVETLIKEAKKKNLNIIETDIKDIIKIDNQTFEYKGIILKHNLIGDFNLNNILSALKIAEIYNTDLKECSKILINYKSPKNRMQIININECMIINDCYNSNPSALKNMINYLSKRKENKKIAVIGDMLEIEPKSEFYHREIGDLINSLNNINVLIACGNYSKYIYQTVNCEKYYFEKAEDSISKIKEFIKEDTAILIKASLGMNFNIIIENIKN